MKDKIEIPLSKYKISLLLIGAMIFVIIGLLFIIIPETFISSIIRKAETIQIVGIVTIVFFGLCLVYVIRKLFDNKTGFSIDENGIIDNSNATSVGLIEWDDITGIETLRIASTKILLLRTDKPEKYIDKAKDGISKRAMKANNKLYGSPLSIISNSLKIKFDDLEQLIKTEFEKRKKMSALQQ